jgi:cytochrome c peroxidase
MVGAEATSSRDLLSWHAGAIVLGLALFACGGGGGGGGGGGAPTDSDCAGPFAKLGLPFGGHAAGPQQLFHVGVGLGRGPEATGTPAPSPTPAGEFAWNLPPGFPRPLVPADNPMSDVKVELGRYLFYDTRLSLNETQSCASCHQQARAFSDGRPVAVGSTGEMTPRNAPSLTNAAYNPTLTWMNPLLVHLEDQILVPLVGEVPIELGFAGREDVLLGRLRGDERYRAMFPAAFPDEPEPISIAGITRAIAAFERTLISGNSPYDRYLRGDDHALSESALRGMEFFFSELLECTHCHGGLNFASALTHEGNPRDPTPFENTGLFNIGGTGAYPEPNTGLFSFTGDPRDMGRMKPPTLRNIELTAPYMHDGSMQTLDEVIEHYKRGGRLIESGPNAGDGARSPFKSGFLIGFPLSAQAKLDLIEFLRSLTDRDFVADPRFTDPSQQPAADAAAAAR